MPRLLAPLPSIQLDPRNTKALLAAMQTQVYLASNGVLNDFSPASPLSAITEGQAYAASEILYYLNNLPEAFAIQWMKLLGIQRILGANAYAEITFVKTPGYPQPVVIPKNTEIFSVSGLKYNLMADVTIDLNEEDKTELVISEKWGSVYNVPPGNIIRMSKVIPGLDSIYNLQAASGGEDLESINEMKTRANFLLRRNALITREDYVNEVYSIYPDLDLVEIVEDQINASNVSIIIGRNSAESVPQNIKNYIFSEIRDKIPIGITFNIFQIETIPIFCKLSCTYNSRLTSSTSIIETIRDSLLEEITLSNIGRGGFLDSADIADNLSILPGIDSILRLNLFGLIPLDPEVEYGAEICDSLFDSYIDSENKCIRKTTNSEEDSEFLYMNLFQTGKLYQLEITLIDQDGNIVIYNYDELYTL